MLEPASGNVLWRERTRIFSLAGTARRSPTPRLRPNRLRLLRAFPSSASAWCISLSSQLTSPGSSIRTVQQASCCRSLVSRWPGRVDLLLGLFVHGSLIAPERLYRIVPSRAIENSNGRGRRQLVESEAILHQAERLVEGPALHRALEPHHARVELRPQGRLHRKHVAAALCRARSSPSSDPSSAAAAPRSPRCTLRRKPCRSWAVSRRSQAPQPAAAALKKGGRRRQADRLKTNRGRVANAPRPALQLPSVRHSGKWASIALTCVSLAPARRKFR